MIAEIGQFALTLALVIAAVQATLPLVGAALYAFRKRPERTRRPTLEGSHHPIREGGALGGRAHSEESPALRVSNVRWIS